MSSDVEIVRVKAKDWALYRSARIQSLEESPDAFGGTIERARALSDDDWIKRISDLSNEADMPLFAKREGNVVGLAWGKIDQSSPRDAYLFQMWVAPSARGLGTGKQLVESVVLWARAQSAKRLLLSVTIADSAAWQLYKSAGFTPTGEPEPLREGSALMCQPMALGL